MSKELKFQDAMKRLDEIVSLLEKNEIELEESITLFEEGLNLVKNCEDKLTNFEQRVNTLIQDYQGE